MKPVIIFPIADTHTGSTVGLHPYYIKQDDQWITIDQAGGYFYKNNNNFYPNSKQVRIWRHYETGVRAISNLRSKIDADLFIGMMGDAIDGDHHGTHQIVTRNPSEQMKAHVEIMQWTQDVLNWSQYDKLAYIEGTECHTQDQEELIAERLKAERFKGGYSVPFLELTIHGKLIWFFHHGSAAGYSYNQGNGLWLFLKRIYFDRLADHKKPPDLVFTAHTHKYNFQVYKNGQDEVRGIIVPPLQEKTRFTNRLKTAIVHPTKLGFAPVVIYPDKIEVLDPYLYEMPLGEALQW